MLHMGGEKSGPKIEASEHRGPIDVTVQRVDCIISNETTLSLCAEDTGSVGSSIRPGHRDELSGSG